eukprot:SAG22_NODE_396_length_11127_cov_33.460011_4_plen_700_part_00
MTRRELVLLALLVLNSVCLLYVGWRYGPHDDGSDGLSGHSAAQHQDIVHMREQIARRAAPALEEATAAVASAARGNGGAAGPFGEWDGATGHGGQGLPLQQQPVLAKLQELASASSTAEHSLPEAAAPAAASPTDPPLSPAVQAPAPAALAGASPVQPVLRYLQSKLRPPADSRKIVVMGSKQMVRRDRFFYVQAFEKLGFEMVDAVAGDWSPSDNSWTGLLCLSLSDGDDKCLPKAAYSSLQAHQRVSRMPGLRKTLWNKDAFCYTLKTMTANAPISMSDFSFDCWVLPTQYSALLEWGGEKDRLSQAATAASIPTPEPQQYIVKPFSAGEGLGIKLAGSTAELDEFKDMPRIVQPYLSEPLLIKGYKFDIRTYVVVTSITPLRVYMFGESLVRLASTPYQRNSKKRTSFLTNTSVNKKGAKMSNITWSMDQFTEYAAEQGRDPTATLRDIRRAIGLTLLTAEPVFIRRLKKMAVNYDCLHCYQLLGVDIIFDHAWKAHVIEVNGEPSMKPSSESLDSEYNNLKAGMVGGIAGLVYGQPSTSTEATAGGGGGVAAGMSEEEAILQTVLGQLAKYNIGVDGVDCGTGGDSAAAASTTAGGGGAMAFPAICVSEPTLHYLLQLERERLFLGQFTKVYPSADGAYFDSLLQYYHELFGNNLDSTNHGGGTAGLSSLDLPSGTWALSKVLTDIEVERNRQVH